MRSKSQIVGMKDAIEFRGHAEQPWLKIGDEATYVLNPLGRLRNSKSDYVLMWGVKGLPQARIHRAAGIVLALCNGKRTVADIAQITRPLVKIKDDAKATEIARANVKMILYHMSQTQEELKGEPPKHSQYPATSVLLSKADFDREFGCTRFKSVEYCAKDFLPQNLSEISPASVFSRREFAPLGLVWLFTSDCSTDCKYCYLGRRKLKPMSKERTLVLLEEAAAIGVMEILPTGGDMLLYPYLEEILVSMSRHRFLPIELSTKSFLSREKAKVIAEAGSVVMALQFSVDSTINDVADYLVGATNFCDRIFRSIDNALEAGIRVNAKAVITPYNILTIPQLYRDLKKRGVSQIRLASYSRSGFHHSDDLFNHTASYQWLEKQVQKLQHEFPDYGIGIQNGAPHLEPPSLEDRRETWVKERLACGAGRTSMMICTDGKVIPCEQMPEAEEYICGDLTHQSIQEVWDGDRLRELTYDMPREKFKGQACYDCKEMEACLNKGLCVRDLAAFHGGIYQPPANCSKHNQCYIRRV